MPGQSHAHDQLLFGDFWNIYCYSCLSARRAATYVERRLWLPRSRTPIHFACFPGCGRSRSRSLRRAASLRSDDGRRCRSQELPRLCSVPSEADRALGMDVSCVLLKVSPLVSCSDWRNISNILNIYRSEILSQKKTNTYHTRSYREYRNPLYAFCPGLMVESYEIYYKVTICVTILLPPQHRTKFSTRCKSRPTRL